MPEFIGGSLSTKVDIQKYKNFIFNFQDEESSVELEKAITVIEPFDKLEVISNLKKGKFVSDGIKYITKRFEELLNVATDYKQRLDLSQSSSAPCAVIEDLGLIDE